MCTMKYLARLLLALVALGGHWTAHAQDRTTADQQIVLKQLQTEQRAIYASNLGLTDEESRAFWPIYDEYETAIKKVIDARVELLNDYAARYRTLSDEEARAMLGRIWQAEQDALKIRRRYSSKVRAVLPGAKALRYVQLQARIDNVLMGRILSLVPLAPITDELSRGS
jgi:hypothetical protein